MDVSPIQVLLIFIVAFIAGIDQFSFLESLYQPIVTGFLVGLILGDVQTGLIVGGTYQLMTIGNMPVGGAQPPNAVIGGIMSAVFAITTKLEPMAAVAAAIPFSLLGQYAVTIIFTIMSPVMATADAYAEKADPKGIARINYGCSWSLLWCHCYPVLPGWRCIWHSDHHGNSKVAHECTVRRWWHDALRRLCNPAEGYGFSRALGLLPHGLCSCNRIYQHS